MNNFDYGFVMGFVMGILLGLVVVPFIIFFTMDDPVYCGERQCKMEIK